MNSTKRFFRQNFFSPGLHRSFCLAIIPCNGDVPLPFLQFGLIASFLPSCPHTQPGSPVEGNEKIHLDMCFLSTEGASCRWLVVVSVLAFPQDRQYCALNVRTLQLREVNRYLGKTWRFLLLLRWSRHSCWFYLLPHPSSIEE